MGMNIATGAVHGSMRRSKSVQRSLCRVKRLDRSFEVPHPGRIIPEEEIFLSAFDGEVNGDRRLVLTVCPDADAIAGNAGIFLTIDRDLLPFVSATVLERDLRGRVVTDDGEHFRGLLRPAGKSGAGYGQEGNGNRDSDQGPIHHLLPFRPDGLSSPRRASGGSG